MAETTMTAQLLLMPDEAALPKAQAGLGMVPLMAP